MLKIKNQFLIIILTISLIPLAVVMIIASHEASVITEELELEELKSKILSESHKIDLEFNIATSEAGILAKTPAIKKLSMMNHEKLSHEENILADLEKNRMLGYWEDIMNDDQKLLKIRYNDASGNTIASISKTNEGLVKNTKITKDPQHQELDEHHKMSIEKDKIHILKFHEFSLEHDGHYTTYYTPIFIEKTHRGSIIIDFFHSPGIFLDDELENNKSIFLLDKNYNFIHPENFLEKPNYSYLNDNLEELVTDGFFDGDSKEFETQDEIDIASKKYYYDEQDNFFIIVITSLKESVNSFNDFLTTLFLVTAGITIIIVLFVAKTVSKPIIEISNISKTIGKEKTKQIEINSSIEEISELASSINKMSKQISEIDIQKNEFTSMVVHELKTPIVPIQGHAEMLSDESLGKLNPEQEKSLEEITKHLKTLTDFIDRLLLIHKMELKQFEFNPEKINLKILVDDIQASYVPIFEKHKIKMAVDIPENINIKADIKNLKEVFTNLIQNAVDFVPASNGEILISAKKINDFIEISVKDNGIGIPLEQQKSFLKEKFYQVDKSMKRKHGGSGLGLYICNMIINQHNGTISINSDEDKGCEFVIKIPQ